MSFFAFLSLFEGTREGSGDDEWYSCPSLGPSSSRELENWSWKSKRKFTFCLEREIILYAILVPIVNTRAKLGLSSEDVVEKFGEWRRVGVDRVGIIDDTGIASFFFSVSVILKWE